MSRYVGMIMVSAGLVGMMLAAILAGLAATQLRSSRLADNPWDSDEIGRRAVNTTRVAVVFTAASLVLTLLGGGLMT